MNNKPLSRQNNIVVQELENEILLYDLKSHKAFCLNETSALVWQLCDGNKSVAEIAGDLSRKLNSPVNEEFVWLALEQLKKEKLVLNCEKSTEHVNGLSRREVIRKVGSATMVALPLVSVLIAPKAIYALSPGCDDTSVPCTVPSGRPNNCCCQNGPQCQSGNCVGIGGGLKACRP